MSQVVKGNKHSGTEDDLGLLHMLTTKVFLAKMKKWNKLIEAGGDPDLIVDMKAMANVIKFIQHNGVVCADPADVQGSELDQAIQSIKDKHGLKLVANGSPLSFTEEEEY